MVGSVLFLIAAVIVVTVYSENEGRISNARGSSVQGRMQFVAETIMADSYNVFLQNKLEQSTLDFMEDGYDINTQESWRQSFKSGLVGHYIDDLGRALGIDVSAYTEAYGNMPQIKDCVVERANESQSSPSVRGSDRADGTLMARGYSYGERIKCTARENNYEVVVDITGRYYRLNIRVPELYEIAKWILTTTKSAIDSGIESMGIMEPLATWEDSKWHIIKKTDNKMLNPSETGLDYIITDWTTKIESFTNRMIGAANNEIRSADGMGKVGITLIDLEILNEENKEYMLDDFDVSCVADGVGEYRNCMPYRIQIRVGDSDCEIGSAPEDSENPFYSLNAFSAKCGIGNCPSEIRNVLKDIIRPLGSVCIDYYGVTDSVYPVCKKWEGKPRSLLITGTLQDDNQEFVILGENVTEFLFKDQHPNVVANRIKGNRLKCESGDDDGERYKDNVRRLLEKTELKIGSDKIQNSDLVRWVDKGSTITQLDNPSLTEVYKTLYGQGILPIPCFTDGAQPDEKCGTVKYKDKPRMEIIIDWGETRDNCVERINDLCNALCGGSAKPEFTDSFCQSLFPENRVGGGKGNLVCSCGKSELEIDLISLGL
jgi:hypothetical protein